jgi:hypothetical protein
MMNRALGAPDRGHTCSRSWTSRYHKRLAARRGPVDPPECPMKLVPIAALAALAALPAAADEGMWTFDNPPREAIRQKLGVTLDSAWLERAREATVRLDGGCTGSFISAEGLILTNHHCAKGCIAQNSSAGNDFMENGFLAGGRDQELRCEEDSVSILVGTEDVTAKVAAALEGVAPEGVIEARRAALTKLEQACEEASRKSGSSTLKCERVSLYQGGQHWIYKYRRYEDVRLVFAPEGGIAAFGGDPDNFQFPRWNLDMSILRAWDGDKPARTPNHLRFDWDGVEPGDAVFVTGHPGNTDRLLTAAQLEVQRDTFMPFWLMRFSELRGRMIQYSKTGDEPRRTAEAYLYSIENSIKVRRKQFDALLEPALIENARGKEQALETAAESYEQIARAQQGWRNILVPYTFIESGAAFNSQLFVHARTLVRAATERAKPNETRLPEFTEARLPAVTQGLKADSPIYPELEILRLSFGLERMREWLGPDHPVVRQVFGKDSPDTLAERLVRECTLGDAAARMTLFEGGQAAIDASQDPMIRLAAAVDPAARALRKTYETEVDGPVARGQEAIAKARFAKYGTSIYPDATFTLRLSFGAMKGWNEKGRDVQPWTEISGAFARATGEPPFRIPASWLAARDRIDLTARANFITNNDVVGGNSGSPMLSAAGEIVGLVFDGNIHSISGSYWFDERTNRTIGVHPAFMRTALEQVYGAKALLEEIDRR